MIADIAVIARDREGKPTPTTEVTTPPSQKRARRGPRPRRHGGGAKIAAEFLSDPRASASICGKVNRMQVLRAGLLFWHLGT